MRRVMTCLFLVMLVSLTVSPLNLEAGPGICGPEDPNLFCGRYCNVDGNCWGPAPASAACLLSGFGCVGVGSSICCFYAGAF